MPNRTSRSNNTALLIGGGVILLILVAVLFAVRQAQKQTAVPQVLPLPTQGLTQPVSGAPSATPTALSVTNPNEFHGDWQFIKMSGTATSGVLKGHDIGEFKSAVNGEIIHATCAAPRSPSPKMGDLFYWDSHTNILVPYVSDVIANGKLETVQRFWNPTRN
jgi:hypothetical protein